jgi:hypothetical protein
MNRYLCTSIIIIVLILVVVLYENGSYIDENGNYIDENGNEILTPNQLRGMYVEGVVYDRYTKIYNGVIQTAIEGKTNFNFTIMCIRPRRPGNCDNYDGYKEWLKAYGSDTNSNIQPELVKTRVIEKYNQHFQEAILRRVIQTVATYIE